MKSTGVTRKIDELGRVVIPKEIRRNLGIRDGESLEIFIEEGNIVLKKFNHMHSFEELGNKLCMIISSIIDANIMITDREKIVCTDEKIRELKGKKINKYFLSLIDNRETLDSNSLEKYAIEDKFLNGYLCVVPIISSIDCLGLIMILTETKKEYLNYAKLMSKMLAEKIDIC